MATIGDIVGRLTLDNGAFLSAIDASQRKLERMAGTATKVGAAMSAALTLPLVAIGKKAIEMGSQMEQAEIAFKTMLGSAEKGEKFLKDLFDFASKTPFQFVGLQQEAKRLLALGFAAEDIIPTLTSVGNAVAGLGGGDALIGRVTLALGQMNAKTKVSAEEMRQLAEAGIPAWQALADAVGMSVPQAMKAAEKGTISAAVAIPAILESMNKKFGGLMEAQNKTILGLFSNLQDIVDITLADIGKELGDALNLRKVIPAFADGIRTVLRWFQSLDDGTRKFILLFTTALAASGPILVALGGFMFLLSTLTAPILIGGAIIVGLSAGVAKVASDWERFERLGIAVWENVTKFIRRIAEIWLPMLSRAWENIRRVMLPSLEKLEGGFHALVNAMNPMLIALAIGITFLKPWMLIVAAITAVSLAGLVLLNNWETLSPALVEVFQALFDAFLSILSAFTANLPTILDSIVSLFDASLGATLFAALAIAWLVGGKGLLRSLGAIRLGIIPALAVISRLFMVGALAGVILWLAKKWDDDHQGALTQTLNDIVATIENKIAEMENPFANFSETFLPSFSASVEKHLGHILEKIKSFFSAVSSLSLGGMMKNLAELMSSSPTAQAAPVAPKPVPPVVEQSWKSLGESIESTERNIDELNRKMDASTTPSFLDPATLQRSKDVQQAIDEITTKIERLQAISGRTNSAETMNDYRARINEQKKIFEEVWQQLQQAQEMGNKGLVESTQRALDHIGQLYQKLFSDFIFDKPQKSSFIQDQVDQAKVSLASFSAFHTKTFSRMGEEVMTWSKTVQNSAMDTKESVAAEIAANKAAIEALDMGPIEEEMARVKQSMEGTSASILQSTKSVSSGLQTEFVGKGGAAIDAMMERFTVLKQKVSDLVAALNATPEAQGLKALADDLMNSFQSFNEIKENIKDVPNVVKEAMDQSTRSVQSGLSFWQLLFNSFKISAEQVMQGFADSIVQVMATIRTNFVNTIVGMMAGTATFKEFLTTVWQSIMSIILNTLLQMGAQYLATALFMDSVDQARNTQTVIAHTAVEQAKTAVSAESEAARVVISAAASKAALGGAVATVSAIGAVGAAAMAVMGAVVTATAGVLMAIGAALAASIFGAPFAPGYFAAAAAVEAAGAISIGAGTAAIGGAVSGAVGTISALMATPFAEGGMVTGPTLALIGEAGPEVVAPFSEVERMMSGSDDGEQSITIILDGRVLAKSTARHLPKIIRMQGVPI